MTILVLGTWSFPDDTGVTMGVNTGVVTVTSESRVFTGSVSKNKLLFLRTSSGVCGLSINSCKKSLIRLGSPKVLIVVAFVCAVVLRFGDLCFTKTHCLRPIYVMIELL